MRYHTPGEELGRARPDAVQTAGRSPRLRALVALAVVTICFAASAPAWLPTAMAIANGCTIKGNISWSGERIYHMPGQRYYDPTVINISRGERWFCSETDARAAGWRRARM